MRNFLLIIFVILANASPVWADEKSAESKLISRGIAFVEAGEHKKGIELFKQVIATNPGSFDAHNNLGLAYHAAGRFVEAIKTYRKALKIEDSSDVYNNIGLSYRSLGKYSPAIDAYEEAIKRDPNNAVAYMNLGTAYDLSGNLEKAIAAYRKSIDIKPDFAEAHYNLGVAYQNSGKFDAALKSYEQTIRLNPSHGMARFNLGRVYLTRLRRDAALNEYGALKELAPALAAKLSEIYKKVPIFFGEDGNLYYDLFTIMNIRNDIYSVWTFVEFTKKAFVADGKTSRIIYFLKEIDCRNYISRDTKTYVLHIDNTKSKITDAERIDWKPVVSGSPFEAVVKMVCSRP